MNSGIAGGVYGNIFAIKKLLEYSDAKNIVYNGDLHWFDADKKYFEMVESLSEHSTKLNGKRRDRTR